MCASTDCAHKTPFDDIESDLDAKGIFDAIVARDALDHEVQFAEKTGATPKQQVKIPCAKCGGSGTWSGGYSSYGRRCFACDGKGHIMRAANYAANKAKRDLKKVRDEESHNARIAAYWAANAEVFAWLNRGLQRGNEFATSLINAVNKYGELTPGQHAAVTRIIEQDAARAAERAAATPAAPVSGLDLSALPEGRYAVPGGDTRLKVMVRKPDEGKWAGFIFVSDDAAYGQRQTYGKQSPGRAYTGQIVEQLQAILADPRAASVAYGKLVGSCGICGRRLEDATSIAAGIGPICAGKAGW